MITFSITAVGLTQNGMYPHAVMMLRKGFYQLISAHTGTGYQTIYASQFGEWNQMSIFGLICAMSLGGAVCSTTGAIKMLRVGFIFKASVEDIKRIILPERAVVVQKYHHIKDIFLEDKSARLALFITLAYILLFAFGALVGMFCGNTFVESLFESTSAAANVGLSCGVTRASMPAWLKLTYMFQMWVGRLEFMSVFTLIGFFVAAIKGK
jgi:trk system potassium uptake protein TrkH